MKLGLHDGVKDSEHSGLSSLEIFEAFVKQGVFFFGTISLDRVHFMCLCSTGWVKKKK